MSKLGKILLYVAVAGVLADLYGSYAAWQKFGDDKTAYTQVQQAKADSDKAASAARQAADTATQAATAAKTELTETKSKVDDLTSKLAAAQKASDDANAALTTAQTAAQTAKDALQKINDTLGMTPEAAKDAIKKAQDDLAASQSDLKIMQDQKQAAEEQVDELKKDINLSKTGTIPPGVSGKVTFVNRAWNFVVLNVGLTNGVVPNGELIIYRGRDFLGKVKVTSAESSSAVADILPDAKADIQVGDDVLN